MLSGNLKYLAVIKQSKERCALVHWGICNEKTVCQSLQCREVMSHDSWSLVWHDPEWRLSLEHLSFWKYKAMRILFILNASISNYEHLCLSLKNDRINTDYQECVIVNVGGSGKYCHCSHKSSSPDSTVSHQTIKKETLSYTGAFLVLLKSQHAE